MSYNDITIIITSFRSDKKINKCINSIDPRCKILLIENSNNTELKDEIEKKFKNVECILTGKNLGYSKANNLGLKRVKTKFSLILNPDIILENSALEIFLSTASKLKNFALMGPITNQANDFSDKSDLKTNEPFEVENIKGFAMFLNMEKFNSDDFFDENFFLFFEEIDICRRLKIKNEKIYIDPKIKIYHEGAKSVDESIDYQVELTRNWHWMWSTFYYHKKYNGFFLSFIIVFPKLVSSFFRILLYFFVFNKKKRKIYFQRLNGLINSILGKKAWYRPTLD